MLEVLQSWFQYFSRGGPLMVLLAGLGYWIWFHFFTVRGRLERALGAESGPLPGGESRAGPVASFRSELLLLETLVAAAPLLGLLGTVWGLVLAFGGGEPSRVRTLGAVSSGVGEALITTQFGLLIAVCGMFGVWRIRSRVKKLENRLEASRFVPEPARGGGAR